MSVFNEYARYYDLLYRDKDYVGEVEYVHRLLQAHAPGAQSLLNLGCGSGPVSYTHLTLPTKA